MPLSRPGIAFCIACFFASGLASVAIAQETGKQKNDANGR